MGEAVINDPGYPSLQTVVNLWRALVNDPNGEIIQTPLVNASTGAVITTSVSFTTDPAQGQYVTGEQSLCSPILASSVREVARKMRNISSQTLIKDNVCILNLPTMNSPSFGEATPDSTVQVQLSTIGFFDGVQSNPNFTLPSDCLIITEVWERLSGTNDSFHKLNKAQNGLSGVGQSSFSLGSWEMRGDTLWMNGATENMDIRLRYMAKLPVTTFPASVDFTQTYIPIPDCEEAVAYTCIYKYDKAQGSGSPESAQAMEGSKADMDNAVLDLRMTQVRAMQGKSYHRAPYAGGGDTGWVNNGQ